MEELRILIDVVAHAFLSVVFFSSFRVADFVISSFRFSLGFLFFGISPGVNADTSQPP